MKKILLLVVFITIGFTSANAQIAYGIKGGLNYNMPELTGDAVKGLDVTDELGFNVGAFLRVKIPIIGLYVQGEPTYTKLNSTIDEAKLGTNRFDLPVFAGLKMLGLLRIYAGPVFSWNLGSSLDEQDIELVLENGSSVGGQAGVGVELGPIMLDARYEFGVQHSYVIKAGGQDIGNLDARGNQLILGAAWKF